MSLPPAQQRMLDSMAEALRVSEPRLASMFAIFTRLTKNEASPRREQLPRRRRFPVRLRLALLGRRGPVAPRSGVREFWLRVLIASPLAIGLTVTGLVFGLGSHPASPGCTAPPAVHVAAQQHIRSSRCGVQLGSGSNQTYGSQTFGNPGIGK